MDDFNEISETLFVPMMGRIFASEHFPNILYDEKALELKNKLPKLGDNQSEYTYMASAVRSMNMDRYISEFMKKNPEGIIFELGCGLETTYFRFDNGHNLWYGLDLEEVINYRKQLLPDAQRQVLLSDSILEHGWIDDLSNEFGDKGVLFIAGGLFHYFEESKSLIC